MMAVLLDRFTDIDLASIILGLAPGGQAEIALNRDGSKREPCCGHDTPRPPLANNYHDWPHIAFALITKSKPKRHSSV